MRIPPPDDWDGITYDCIELQWPRSDKWRMILAGMLTGLARGYLWQVETKAENDAAKALAKLIIGKNLPLKPCEVCQDQETGGTSNTGGSGSFGGACCADTDDCEDNMSCVTDVTIEDGHLWVHYGPCCKIDAGSLASVIAESGGAGADGDVYDDASDVTGETYTGTACAKATGMVELVWGVLDSAVTYANETIPLTFVKNVKNDHPEVTISNIELYRVYLEVKLLQAMDMPDPLGLSASDDWGLDTITDPRRKEEWICRLAARMVDGLDRPEEADVDSLIEISRAIYPVYIGQIVSDIASAIGHGDIRTSGQVSATDEVTCGCPSLVADDWYTLPDEATWAYFIDFTVSKQGFDENVSGKGYTAGLGFWADVVKDDQTGNWQLVRAQRTSDTGLVETKLVYMAAHSSALPTGTHMRNPLGFGLGGSAFYSTTALPLLTTYQAYIAGGVAWGSEIPFQPFTNVTFDAGPLDQGTHVFDKLVLAGTGTPPFSGLTNLLA